MWNVHSTAQTGGSRDCLGVNGVAFTMICQFVTELAWRQGGKTCESRAAQTIFGVRASPLHRGRKIMISPPVAIWYSLESGLCSTGLLSIK